MSRSVRSVVSLARAGACLSGLDQLLDDVVYGGPGGCGAARRVEAGEFRGAHPGERGDHAEQFLRFEPVADHLVALRLGDGREPAALGGRYRVVRAWLAV